MECETDKLVIESLSKTFFSKEGPFTAVDNISFKLKRGEFLVVLGPGRSGKTVLLNMIAGLEQATGGKMYLDNEPHEGISTKIGMVFQKLALLPFRTVIQNVEMGPKFAGEKKNSRRKRAARYIELVGLNGFENHYPYQLSGGMKQRVGIARAYTNNPEILLMDEPFGQLDAQTRYSMQDEILRIWEKEKRTIIFVTNNLEEAIYLGERIILLTECPATVKEIYPVNIPRPRSLVSREFLKLRQEISDNTDLAI